MHFMLSFIVLQCPKQQPYLYLSYYILSHLLLPKQSEISLHEMITLIMWEFLARAAQ